MAEPLTIVRVADTETTGLADPKEMCEIGWTDIRLFPTGWAIESGPHARIVNPGMPITPGARAAHHLSDEDVADGMSPDEARAMLTTGVDYLCFHNALYDCQLVKPKIPVICTYKCSKERWPDLESHKNGAIWYALGLGGGAKQMEPVHRAGPDSWTTAHILLDLLRIYTPDMMVEISRNPLRLLKVTFGKHNGKTFAELPWDYLDWIVNKSEMCSDPEKEDVVYSARLELQRRAEQEAPSRAGSTVVPADPDAWRNDAGRF
jgi:exodeoxyribonuclease X